MPNPNNEKTRHRIHEARFREFQHPTANVAIGKRSAFKTVTAGMTSDTGRSGVSLALEHLATTVETGGADVMTQVDFTRGGLNGGARGHQRIVRAVHAALGRRLLVLLNGHEILLIGLGARSDRRPKKLQLDGSLKIN
jgi:hypothetical protein